MSRAELIGRSAVELLHPDDQSRAIESLHRTIEGGPGAKDPFFARVRHADGRWLPIELVANNLSDDPAVGGVVMTMRDIADRDRADRLQAEAEAGYRRIVETAEEGVWTFDANLITTFVNRRMAEMLGVTPEDMVGTSVFDVPWTPSSGLEPTRSSRRTRTRPSHSGTRSGSSIVTGTTCGPGAARRRSSTSTAPSTVSSPSSPTSRSSVTSKSCSDTTRPG